MDERASKPLARVFKQGMLEVGGISPGHHERNDFRRPVRLVAGDNTDLGDRGMLDECQSDLLDADFRLGLAAGGVACLHRDRSIDQAAPMTSPFLLTLGWIPGFSFQPGLCCQS